jgi:hypothetical protein
MKTFLLSFFSLLTILCCAQDSSFHLKDYKYRTSGYQALEFSLGLHGYLTDDKLSASEKNTHKGFDLYPSWITYSRLFSSDKRTHFTSVTLSPSFSSHSQKTTSAKASTTNFQTSVAWQLDDRFYKRKNWFFQLSNYLYLKDELNKQTSLPSENRTRFDGVHDGLSIGIGKGRIEAVNDAQMALYILNDLKEQGLLAAVPDGRIIDEFAQLITAVNNKRVFDFRKRRIFELASIDSFLREKGLISSPGIRHFTVINDNWTFALTPQRLSGHDWFLQLQSLADVGKTNQNARDVASTNISEQKSQLFGAGPKAGYENYKPLSLKLQRNFGATISWQTQKNEQRNKSTINGNTSQTKTVTKQTQTQLYAFYGIGYYPNNRTIVNTNLAVEGFRSSYHDGSLNKMTVIRPSLNFTANYFISYRTRLTANLTVYYEANQLEYDSLPKVNRRLVNSAFNLSLTHTFF